MGILFNLSSASQPRGLANADPPCVVDAYGPLTTGPAAGDTPTATRSMRGRLAPLPWLGFNHDPMVDVQAASVVATPCSPQRWCRGRPGERVEALRALFAGDCY